MKTLTLLALFVLSTVSAHAFGWPKPILKYTNYALAKDVQAHTARWFLAKPGNIVGHAALTGSMKPYIQGGEREFLLEEAYTNQPLTVGMVVVFDRDAKTPRCLHMIADISKDGERLYLSGTNNRYSDGWFHRSKVSYILREILTLPR